MIAMPWRVLSTCLLVVSSLGFVPGTQAESASPGARSKDIDDASVRPNVLVVVVDDLGWKDVGFHDASFSTPNMDIMVAEGVELSTFYAAATCTPSRAQLMTGRYSYRIGMQDSVLHSTEPRGVPLTETFVGERLQTAGYTTAAVGKWHLGMHMPQYLPKERGFDEFYGILTGGGGHYEHMSVSMEFSPRGAVGMPRTFAGPNIVDGNELSEDNKKESMSSHLHTTELYTRKAAEFLETMSAKDDPWFLYLSYQAIHDPIETDDTWINDRSCESISEENNSAGDNDDTDYDNRKIACGMVAQIDNGLGGLRTLLEDLDEWDNTVLIFFSDNGGLPSHGSVNRPFRGAKGEYWEGGVHVPAFFSGGFVSSSLARSGVEPYRYGHITHVTDIHATMLRLAGLSDDEDKLDGFDLWEALVETKAPARESVIINLNSANFAKSGAVRWGKYKLIRNPEPMETAIYTKVEKKLIDEELIVSESVLAKATSEVHALLHMTEPKMFLFDLEENPSEANVDGCGTDKKLGPPAACGNLYDIPAFHDIRKKLERIFQVAEEEAVIPSLRWMNDGPLADPLNFGGWIPWRDSSGDPLANYQGVDIEGMSVGGAPEPRVVEQVLLAEVGSRVEEEDGGGGEAGVSMSTAHAGSLAMFFAVLAIGMTFVAYRAGQRSLYHILR